MGYYNSASKYYHSAKMKDDLIYRDIQIWKKSDIYLQTKVIINTKTSKISLNFLIVWAYREYPISAI